MAEDSQREAVPLRLRPVCRLFRRRLFRHQRNDARMDEACQHKCNRTSDNSSHGPTFA